MTLQRHLAEALTTSDPWVKAENTRLVFSDWQKEKISWSDTETDAWPEPATRSAPKLEPPSAMPKRGLGSLAGRTALIHAVAHIELNAIDLALDIVGRFAGDVDEDKRAEFIKDWLTVADDEARHFLMVDARLREMGSMYGVLPAHDGLWQAAQRTKHDLLSRLAIAPLVLEARGLDVTPGMIDGLTRANDLESVAVLQTIYDEEINHVAAGARWFNHLCRQRALCPGAAFAEQVISNFAGGLKRPFNHEARDKSGFPRDWYEGVC